jgi:hypothetical protein
MVNGTKLYIFLKQEYSMARSLLGIHYIHYITYLYNARQHSLCTYVTASEVLAGPSPVSLAMLLCLPSSTVRNQLLLITLPWGPARGPLLPRWRPFSQDPRTLPPHSSEQEPSTTPWYMYASNISNYGSISQQHQQHREIRMTAAVAIILIQYVSCITIYVVAMSITQWELMDWWYHRHHVCLLLA